MSDWPNLLAAVLASGVLGGGGAGFATNQLTDHRLRQLEKAVSDLDRAEQWGAMQTRVDSLERQVRSQWQMLRELRRSE